MARILLVDDEPDALLWMRSHLERAGHQTVLAAGAEQALERLAGVDVVVVDIGMLLMDGWRVLDAVRTRAGAPGVVVVSGRPNPRDVQRALELGAVDHVRKPASPDCLVDAVQSALSRTRQPRDAHRFATFEDD